MYKKLCSENDLMMPRYNRKNRELIIPCSMLVAEQIIKEDRNFEYAKIKGENNERV